jgi:hypothetical protein
MVSAYLQMNDAWFITKAHDFSTFINNLAKIGLFLDTGQVATKADAQFADTQNYFVNQMNRLGVEPK